MSRPFSQFQRAAPRPGSRIGAALLALPLVFLVAALLLWPVGRLAIESLRPGSGIVHGRGEPQQTLTLTLSGYREILTDRGYRKALVHSVGLSLGVAAAATILCLGPAWVFVRRDFPGKRFVRAVFTLPMSFSGIIIGFLTIIMLGRIGVVPRLLHALTGREWLSGFAYQFGGLALAYLYFEIPRATLTLEAALKRFDFTLDAAARTLGAGRWRRLFLVVLPLLRPALLSTFAVTFSVSLGSFGVALIVSKRFSLLSLEIFQLYTGLFEPQLAAAMSMVLIAVALAVNGAARALSAVPAGRSRA